jgi:hypothetical protein
MAAPRFRIEIIATDLSERGGRCSRTARFKIGKSSGTIIPIRERQSTDCSFLWEAALEELAGFHMGLSFSGVTVAIFMPPHQRNHKQANNSYLQSNRSKQRGADSFDSGIFPSRFWDAQS